MSATAIAGTKGPSTQNTWWVRWAEKKDASFMKSYLYDDSVMDKYQEALTIQMKGTKLKEAPTIYVPSTRFVSQKNPEESAIEGARAAIDSVFRPLLVDQKNPLIRNAIYSAIRTIDYADKEYDAPPVETHDPDTHRIETRNKKSVKVEYWTPTYTKRKGGVYAAEGRSVKEYAWKGDPEVEKQKQPRVQIRKKRQSRLFITYSLHRPVRDEVEARFVVEKMADACHAIFGDERTLSELLVFGYRIEPATARREQDTISRGGWDLIAKPRKDEENWYATATGSSYAHDTYESHVEKVDVEGGVEIGPNRFHPHFHVLLTIDHYSLLHFDYFKMNAYLEAMFRGVDWHSPPRWGDSLSLMGFYTDNETPYVKIKLYPQDNWAQIISAYVQKSVQPGIVSSVAFRHGKMGEKS